MEGAFWIVKFATLLLMSLTSTPKAEIHKMARPDPEEFKCFSDIDHLYGILENEEAREYCSQQYLDKKSSCFKICMLRENEILTRKEIPDLNHIWEYDESFEIKEQKYTNQLDEVVTHFNFTVNPKDILNTLTHYILDEYEINPNKNPKFSEALKNIENRAKKCETMSIVVPRDEHECYLFSPEAMEAVKKLKDCIEESMRC